MALTDQFALARARRALEEAGLRQSNLSRAASVTNEVWLTDDYVVRVNRRISNRLRREAHLGPLLPPEVGYPPIVAYGGEMGADWLVQARVAGVPLVEAWADMDPTDRRRSVRRLAGMLRSLHGTPTPPDLLPAENVPQLLDPQRLPIVAPLLEALDELEAHGIDHGLIADTRHLILSFTAALEPFPVDHLVHGDLHLLNVLWDGMMLTALLDFEYARGAPADLDLDMFLRFCAHPWWFVGDDMVGRIRPDDFAEVPYWLREDYPELFDRPYLLERLLLFSLSHDVHDLSTQLRQGPLPMAPPSLPSSHAYQRILATLRGRCHLHRLAGHTTWDGEPQPVRVGQPLLADS